MLLLAFSVGQITPASAAAILSATKVDSLYTDSDGDSVADLGDIIKYTITVFNTGDAAAANVHIRDPLDLNLLFNDGLTSDFSLDSLGYANSSNFSLGASSNQSFDLFVEVTDRFTADIVSNQAYVYADGLTTAILSDDPDTLTQVDATVTAISQAAVPEPATLALFGLGLGLGLAGIPFVRRRRTPA